MWPLFFLNINVVLTVRKIFNCKTVSLKPGGTYGYNTHQPLRGQEVMARVHIWINIVRMKRQYPSCATEHFESSRICFRPWEIPPC